MARGSKKSIIGPPELGLGTINCCPWFKQTKRTISHSPAGTSHCKVPSAPIFCVSSMTWFTSASVFAESCGTANTATSFK